MTAGHILDAIGLLDDDLIQEAEQYIAPKRRSVSPAWLGLAASFVIVAVLGYGAVRSGPGGADKAEEDWSGGASMSIMGDLAEPGAAGGSELPPSESDWPLGQEAPGTNGSGNSGGSDGSVLPESPEGDWLLAIMVDGVIYRDTYEHIHLEPEESDIRYTTSFLNSWDPEEDGQANFEPVGTPYVVLDDGTVAVLWNEDTGTWRVFGSAPPWER